jgi:hypothetical protein
MASRASTGRGMRVAYDKEATDPGQSPEHHTPHFHQRQRRSGGNRSKDRVHNRTGEDACRGRRDRGLPQASLADAHPLALPARASVKRIASDLEMRGMGRDAQRRSP